jgi:glycosyltransferase involved in cell wall biosynthesis
MPKVAVFSTYFLQYSQTFIHDELVHLTRYEADVVCARRMNTERFPFPRIHLGGPLYPYLLPDRAIDRAFAARGFDVAHAHFGPGAVYGARYARRFSLPLVVTFHGYDVPLLRSPGRFTPTHLRYALLGPRMLAEMTLGLCASTELRNMLVDLGVPSERLRLHHIGIDTELFRAEPRPSGEEARVVMVGRFVPKKGFEYGLRAFAQVAPSRRARLVLVGDGELAPRLGRLARELGVGDRVDFLGILSRQEVAALLSDADVLLAPSVVARDGNRESGLLTVKEACASGVVPIGTQHGGIPEIIDDGRTGYLVPERDVTALATRLALVLDEPELRIRLGRAAREKVARTFDIRVRVAALEDFYDEARQSRR